MKASLQYRRCGEPVDICTVTPLTPSDFYYSDPGCPPGCRIPNIVTEYEVFDSFRLNTPPPIMAVCQAPSANQEEPFASTCSLPMSQLSQYSNHNGNENTASTDENQKLAVVQLSNDEDQAVTALMELWLSPTDYNSNIVVDKGKVSTVKDLQLQGMGIYLEGQPGLNEPDQFVGSHVSVSTSSNVSSQNINRGLFPTDVAFCVTAADWSPEMEMDMAESSIDSVHEEKISRTKNWVKQMSRRYPFQVEAGGASEDNRTSFVSPKLGQFCGSSCTKVNIDFEVKPEDLTSISSDKPIALQNAHHQTVTEDLGHSNSHCVLTAQQGVDDENGPFANTHVLGYFNSIATTAGTVLLGSRKEDSGEPPNWKLQEGKVVLEACSVSLTRDEEIVANALLELGMFPE
ncbi:uncharacterized protein LOC114647613 isoform X2 [Erpetoichthys calabaricus]|nr:uncharacterized protein LOC114647613 isoform X2 [Erpetoichthys calabaricus]